MEPLSASSRTTRPLGVQRPGHAPTIPARREFCCRTHLCSKRANVLLLRLEILVETYLRLFSKSVLLIGDRGHGVYFLSMVRVRLYLEPVFCCSSLNLYVRTSRLHLNLPRSIKLGLVSSYCLLNHPRECQNFAFNKAPQQHFAHFASVSIGKTMLLHQVLRVYPRNAKSKGRNHYKTINLLVTISWPD